MERTDVEFTSGGLRCAAWLYRPDGHAGGVACVVMAHGMSLTRHDGLDQYAKILAAAGVAVLVYDHRYLGDSEGEPRQRIQLTLQVQDRWAAVAFARTVDGVDPDRVVVWGYSFSGGSAAVVAATDPRVAGAILAFPFLDGLARGAAEAKTSLRNLAWFQAQVLKFRSANATSRQRGVRSRSSPAVRRWLKCGATTSTIGSRSTLRTQPKSPVIRPTGCVAT
jgi:cephalosporin-C deacetylase-like acetyl esterase